MTAEKKPSIFSIYLIGMVTVAALAVCIPGFLWIRSEYKRVGREAEQLKTAYYQSQKQMVKDEIEKIVDFIDFKRSQTEQRLKKEIRYRILEAHAIALNIYNENKDARSSEDIKKMIKDALRPIRFNKGRGYFFAFDLDGIEQLFADKPEFEGQNLIDLQDAQGKFVIKDMIHLVAAQREGFIEYRWTKPSVPGKDYPKIAFVKYFEPVEWIIGTGEYLDNVEKDIQEEVLERVETVRFGRDGYIFAGQWDGVSLSGPAKGRNMLDVADAGGVKIVQELIAAAKAGGGFVNYVMPDFEDKRGGSKISYVKNIEDWGWYIGAGIYVDEIDSVIAGKMSALRENVKNQVLKSILILVVLLCLILKTAHYVSNRAKKSFKAFSVFFEKAFKESTEIDPDDLYFAEFSVLAGSLNRMVHELKSAEKALRESEQRLKAIFQASPDPVVVYNIEGSPEYLNPAFTRVFGWSLDELRGRRIPFVPEDQKEKSLDKIKELLETGKPVNLETRRLTKHGDLRDVFISAAVINNPGRKPKGIVVNLTDITERNRMEARFQSAQRLESLGTLAGGIAHDFNNLLMGIQGRISLMLADLERPHAHCGHLKEIEHYVHDAADLTRQLLGFARGGKFEVKPTDLNTLVREQTRMFGRTKKEIRILESYQADLWPVEVDRGQIRQILMNLFVNAWQAMPHGGDLSIQTANVTATAEDLKADKLEAGRYVRISVADTGVGMDNVTRQRIFEPFFTTKEMGRGTGLGLASAYGIVKNHKGFITVCSKKNEGTRFEVHLPASDKQVEADEKKFGNLTGGSSTILLVDDEKMIIDVGRQMLEKLGYSVITAQSGEKAHEIYRENFDKIDVVILDMIMPDMDGGEVYAKLKDLRADIKVLLSSGYSIEGRASEILMHGCSGFIQKPFNLQTLSTKIRELTEG